MKKFFLILLLLLMAAAVFVVLDGGGQPEQMGKLHPEPVPQSWVDAKATAQTEAATSLGVEEPKQILFGDLHVHSTFSMDAFLWSLPFMNGEGVHPPADACDYARYCANLDFWSLTDHAESMTPRHWQMAKDMVRQCNAVTDPANPDLVTFLGWEWTQVGQTPQDHYGHRNIVLLETDEDKVPVRPITSGGLPLKHMRRQVLSPIEEKTGPFLTDFPNRQQLKDMFYKQTDLRETPLCEEGVPVRELPADCVESAETPEALFAKLDEWGVQAMAIPHGTSWGFYTPPGVKWDKQLSSKQHDPKYQRMIEVFSGHGNSEEYRDWRAVAYNDMGERICPEPTDDYLPCCHRAGELIQARCEDTESAECAARVDKAEQDYLEASVAGRLVVPGAKPEDWLNCGQCTDCYLPALSYRPGNSVQYIMALSNFDEPDAQGDPMRFRFGFIASSDNHASQPGTGYKEVGRHKNTETFGADKWLAKKNFTDAAKVKGQGKKSVPFDRRNTHFNLFQYAESERLGSYFYTGGLVAVHSNGRQRDSIWNAFNRKEVYGTSGERMLLWFDMLNPGGDDLPMGSEVFSTENPRFRVRAMGGFEQKPGCPEHSVTALGEERLDYMCGGECYNPGDTRHPIERIEVVRIRPQNTPNEDVADLIEDPWKVLQCTDSSNGCMVEFEDPDFADGQREVIYYVRALQQSTATINGAQLRCEYNSKGECIKVNPCFGDDRTERAEDCEAPSAERAWSSPI
ncbi:MAG: DUF3604 domain-containing protein, partial [Nevskiales bacterium]